MTKKLTTQASSTTFPEAQPRHNTLASRFNERPNPGLSKGIAWSLGLTLNVCVLLGVPVVFSCRVFGQETATAEYRTWTSSSDQKTPFRLIAIDQTQTHVRLKREDNGEIVDQALNKLSRQDREYLTSLNLTARPLAGEPPRLRTATPGHTAAVRAICFTPDSKRLCTAGFDKNVHIWTVEEVSRPAVSEDSGESFWKGIGPVALGEKEGSIYWEIGPGTVGQVYAMSAASDPPRIAIAGFGNRTVVGGVGGDVVMADPVRRTLTDMENDGSAHQTSVDGLAFSADGAWLASHSLDGNVWLRRRAGVEHKIELASPLKPPQQRRKFAPIAIANNDLVAYPVKVSEQGPTWKIKLYGIKSRKNSMLDGDLFGGVTTIAASPDGRFLAAADMAGDLHLWEFHSGEEIKLVSLQKYDVQPRRILVSLAFGNDGKTLIGGTADLLRQGDPTLLLQWDLSRSQSPQTRASTRNAVWACDISRDGKWMAYSDGAEVMLLSATDVDQKPEWVGGRSDAVRSVAFAGGEEDYSVVIQSIEGKTTLFDPATGQMTRLPDSLTTANANEAPPGWHVSEGPATPSGGQLIVSRPNLNQLTIPIPYAENGVNLHGAMTCHTWILDQRGQPVQLAVGTAGALGCLFVYDLTDGSQVRSYVGHHDGVNSVHVSSDRKYLVTGSNDGTARYWPLTDGTQTACLSRWGIGLAGNVINRIVDTGPLFYRGVRKGDVVSRILWYDGGRVRTANSPAAIRQQLELAPWTTPVTFYVNRRGGNREPFEEQPAWKHILSVFPSGTDWIAWNPVGYYDCSPNGLRLIGWQNNKDRESAPEYYDAQQFYKTFKQSDLIRSLLPQGSLAGARQAAGLPAQDLGISNPSDVQPPSVTITEPTVGATESDIFAQSDQASSDGESFWKGRADFRVTEPNFHVKAEALASSAQFPLTRMSLQLNGRNPRGAQREARAGEKTSMTAEWTVRLAPGNNSIRVLADTDVSHGKSQELSVWFDEGDQPTRPPSLYVLAIGISEYPVGIASLRFAHSDAKLIGETMASSGQAIFSKVSVAQLTNADATKANILDGLEQLRRNAGPGDIAMVFYSGHGVRDDNNQFYLVSHDGDIDDIAGTCVPDTAITELLRNTEAKVVLLLDACHSGAVQLDDIVEESSRDDYGGGVFVMVSSTGKQLSYEHPEWGAGAFTKVFTEGLTEKADYDPDGMVMSVEINTYVTLTVPKLAATVQRKQNPLGSGFVIPFPLSSLKP